MASAVTQHAQVRMQQRGVRSEALDLLLRYGRAAHDHHGGVVVYMDGRARRRAIRECGREVGSTLDRVRRLYAVLGQNGDVVTVGHRYRRIGRQ